MVNKGLARASELAVYIAFRVVLRSPRIVHDFPENITWVLTFRNALPTLLDQRQVFLLVGLLLPPIFEPLVFFLRSRIGSRSPGVCRLGAGNG
ncbi:hypothetical protein D3C77_475320 [compost metagenome]